MLYLAVCGITAFLSGFPCALFVFLHKPRTPVKVLWSLYCLGASAWGLGIFYLFTTDSHDTALFWGRVINLDAIFIPVFFFNFVTLLTNTYDRYKNTVKLYYGVFIIYFLVALVFPQYYVSGVSAKLNFRFYPDAGFTYYFFPFLFFALFIHGFSILYKAYQKASSIKRNQYKYFFIATLIGIPGGTTTFFPVFNIPIFPFGAVCVPLYMFAIAYIVVKHRLMDVRIVIRKGVIYTILASFITLLYLGTIYVVERMFHHVFGYQSAMGSIASIVLIGVLFVPLKDYVQSFVDRYLFKATYLQVVEQNDILKQQVVRAERYQIMSSLSRRIIDELKSPLTALVVYSYHLPNKLNDEAFLNKFVTAFDKELVRLQGLIKQLSDFSEVKPLDLQPVNVIATVNDLLDHLTIHLQEKNIRLFKYYKDSEEIMVSADMNQLKRALYIFLANSVKLTSSHGQIWVGIDDNADNLEISVKDTGTGLSQEDLAQIFDPFFSTSKGGDDMNMSLAQAQNIISHHGGKVMVDSQLNVGTEWIIQLPKLSKI